MDPCLHTVVALNGRIAQSPNPFIVPGTLWSPILAWGSRAGGVPPASLDASEDLPKQVPRQVALGEQKDELPRLPDEACAGLEEPPAWRALVLDAAIRRTLGQEFFRHSIR